MTGLGLVIQVFVYTEKFVGDRAKPDHDRGTVARSWHWTADGCTSLLAQWVRPRTNLSQCGQDFGRSV